MIMQTGRTGLSPRTGRPNRRPLERRWSSPEPGREPVTLQRRALRLWHMSQNIPARQMLHRLDRRLRRRLAVLLHVRAQRRPLPPLAASLPLPLFAPRAAQSEVTADGFRLILPWGTRDFTLPVSWHPAVPDRREGSWRNRLHYMEYLEGLPDALLERVVLDWIEHNPLNDVRLVRAAWHPFATSIRVVVWMQQIAGRRDRLTPAFVARATASLAAQLRFVERHFENDLRGNHLIKNIKALLWGATFFAGAESGRWRRLAGRLLEAELTEQVLADGTHYERSPGYHCQVMADLLECHAVLPDGPDRAALAATLVAMGKAAALLTHPDGDVAQFNDCGLHNAYTSRECRAVLARHGTVEAPPEGAFALPDAGFFGERRGDDYLIVDCGAIAPDYLIGHGHGDILSFEWSLAGRRIIVDQGTYQNLAGPRRTISRSTLAHNTVSIDRLDQCDFYGAHRCGRRARPELLEWRPTATGFVLVGSHDGFAHLRGAPRHVRRFETRPAALVIEDRLSGSVPRSATAGYLLHPDCRVEIAGPRAVIRSGPVIVDCTAPGPLRLEAAEWYPDLYVAQPTARLRIDLPWGGQGGRTIFVRRS